MSRILESCRRGGIAAPLALAGVFWSANARAADIPADPTSYQSLLGTLQPGDNLRLAAGTYTSLLTIDGLNGMSGAWITIIGPDSGPPAVFEADPLPCCNTVEISNSSYVAIRNLTVDGKMVDGAFGLSAKSGIVHHIRVERCNFIHHDTSQQNVAISTKVPTWAWEIRENRIVGAGTGMYLGNSDGSDPFIAGLIENNLFQDTIGYNVQIKWQLPRPSLAGMPTGPSSTAIRNNVFIKNDQPSPDGDRPNLLVGGFPDSGPGSSDLYQIYGNFLFHNPRESLLQASGRVTIHDNVFVDAPLTALLLANHDLPLKLAHVYNNTIYAAGDGIRFGNGAPEGDAVTGNLIFANTPITGPIVNVRENLVDLAGAAGAYVVNPSVVLGQMDFYPLVGKCQGPPLDLSAVSSELDYDRDFNWTTKGSFTFRGAYVGEGTNPGFQLAADVKPSGVGATPGVDAGTGPDAGAQTGGSGGTTSGAGGAFAAGGAIASGGGSATVSGGGSAGNAAIGSTGSTDKGGCGCRMQRRSSAPLRFAHGYLLLICLLRKARRRRQEKAEEDALPTHDHFMEPVS